LNSIVCFLVLVRVMLSAHSSQVPTVHGIMLGYQLSAQLFYCQHLMLYPAIYL